MAQTARRAFIATLVAVAVIATALALWKLRLVIALVFLGFILSASMRPGIEALRRRRVPRGVGIGIHYTALAGVVALVIWLLVPRAIDQVQSAIGTLPTSHTELKTAASKSTGLKHDILVGLDKRLRRVPSAGDLIRPAAELTVRAFEVLIGIFFVLATAAYWIFERERAMDLVASLLPRPKRKRLVLFSVSAVGILFGGFAVLLAVPIAAVLATLVDVIVRGRDPAEEEVPTVLFPAKDAEG